MKIDTQALTTGEVAADGGAISLGFVDSTGNPATIRLSLNQVGALAMTLPGLIDKALQTRFGDQSLRYAYPLASWLVEQSSDPAQTMVTLRTVDGFRVCFSIPRQQQSELGADPARAEPDVAAALDVCRRPMVGRANPAGGVHHRDSRLSGIPLQENIVEKSSLVDR
jgi:hypothetical protein